MKRDDVLPIEGMDARIAQLSPEKRALVLKWLADSSQDSGSRHQPMESPLAGEQCPPPSRQSPPPSRQSPQPCEQGREPSFAQQRLWFLQQWQTAGGLYNIAQSWWLNGPLAVARLRTAFDHLLARHEALRSALVSVEGQPREQPQAAVKMDLEMVDLQSLPPDQARREALLQAQALAARDFDLAQPPLLRATLYRLHDASHLLVVVIHHIVADGWSLAVLCRELSVFYSGQGEQLPALPMQYADYAQWQRETLQGPELERQLSYWREQLAALNTLDLPTDRRRPPNQSYRGGSHPLQLSAELSVALKRLSGRQRVTPYMLLLAAFQLLLARYSGQHDIAVASPVAGRSRTDFEGLIGLFVNTLVLRSDLSGNPRFCDLLKQVRGTALAAYEHQQLPFEKLVEELKPARDSSRNPLVQVMFALQNAPREALTLADLAVTAQPLESVTAKFDLTLTLFEGPQGLQGELSYASDLFDATTIARLAGHFNTLLEGIVADPESPIHGLPLLSAAERQQLLVQWNDTAAEYPRDRGIHQLFEQQVQRSPEAIAVLCADTQLSYGELNARANQLGHYLHTLGVGADVLVAVCLQRSVELIVALLGILKAGGAYLPLDSGHPPARLQLMLDDSGASVVLTQSSFKDRLLGGNRRVLSLDTEQQQWQHCPVTNPCARVCGRDLAYLMFTSGSTGTPKGVMVTHRGVNRLVCNSNYIQLDANDCIAQVSNPAFDAATFEIWGALVNGSRLAIIADDAVLDPARLGDELDRGGVSTLLLTTALFNEVIRARPRAFAGLKQVLFGGEAADPRRVAECLQAGGPARMLNVYGPTEATTMASWHPLTTADAGQRTIPIGRPLANTLIYILDAYLQPVPVGVSGELCIGGDGLARGYWNRAELTAQRFVRSPFSADPDARLYRTGDRARYRPDGKLEFLGRLDQQVKLRGFRIEPGEIEAVLTKQPGVLAALVLLREDVPGDRQLVAYVVSATLNAAALRIELKRRLPDYMMPAAFVALPALPLTANGKVDLRALPVPARATSTRPSSPPRNPLEEAVAGIWCELLQLQQVGVHDNFFELGGQSLRGMQMLSWLRDLFRVELPIATLFEGPTIAELAEQLRIALAGGNAGLVAPMKGLTASARPALSFAQQRLWFLQQWQANGALYNIARSWWLQGPLHVERLRGAFVQLLARHESLRTALVSTQGQPWQQLVAATDLPLEVVDLRKLAADQARPEALQQARELAVRGFDLSQPPLLRVALYRLTDDEHLLVLVIHHIVADGWSLGVLCRELTTLYDDLGDRLPALPLQYVDYAQWQRETLQGAVLQRQLSYWRRQLAALDSLELPTDRVRPPTQSHRGGHQSLQLSAELSAALQQLSQSQRVTPYMLLLAAFQLLLARYSGQHDIAVGSPIAGRNRREFEGLIGFFVNTLVLRSDLGGNPPFTELLERVRDTALQAYAHQDVPFEKLVEELKPERDPSRNPLIQVMFALQNAAEEELMLAQLTVTEQQLNTAVAKFDLTLALAAGPNGLHGVLNYATDLFDAATIARMAGHFVNLLEAIVAAPETPIDELSLLSAAERQQLLVQWNDTAVEYPREQSIQQLFEQRVREAPATIALVFEDRHLSYAELNARANQLAHHLSSLGVGPEVLVGLYLERSVELVVAVLGILKAGGAYLPLDAGSPKQRLALLLEDTQAPVLLTQSGLLPRLPDTRGHILCLDRDWPTIAAQSNLDPPCQVSADNLAYVIYTSGSTGQPKGVAVPQRCVARLVLGADYVRFGAQETFLLLAPMAFDASVFELWGALLHGGRCVIYPQQMPTAAGLEAVISRHGVTTVWLTAALFNAVIDERPAALQGLRQLLTGGEALSVRHVRRALAALPDVALFNGYGPTEGTTFSCCHPIPRTLPIDSRAIPIGRPIANTRTYILDSQRAPVPVGVAGELYIAGDGLARGYWNRPQLTAERFGADPFSGVPGSRLYRSGDRVRYLADGSIEFLGRLDQQLKLRGFRIEPGEIEALLVQQPQVREALVLLREYGPNDQRLVAYVVTRTLDRVALRTALSQRLPDYMIPDDFIALESLPLTPNGKIDRQALPAPRTESPALPTPAAPPGDYIDRHLVRIWEVLLKRDGIGVEDNFFELGGTSLLAVQLMDQIEKTFQRRLPLDSLWFRGATVQALAALIRDEYSTGANPELVAIKSGCRQPLFVVHTMGGNLFHYYELSRLLDTDQAVYGLQARGVFGNGQPDPSVAAIAGHCLQSMRAVQANGPYLIAGFSSGGVVAYEMAQQLKATGERVALLAMLDSYAPQALKDKPLLTELAALLQDRSQFRQLQERLYFSVLHGMKLDRWRNLRSVGEAHRWAHWSYSPKPYPHAVEFFIAEESRCRAQIDGLGWSGLVNGSARIHYLPGSHGELVKSPVVDQLAALLQARIDAAVER